MNGRKGLIIETSRLYRKIVRSESELLRKSYRNSYIFTAKFYTTILIPLMSCTHENSMAIYEWKLSLEVKCTRLQCLNK